MQLQDQIEQELKTELESLLDLEDKITALSITRDNTQSKVNRLNRAYQALTGSDRPGTDEDSHGSDGGRPVAVEEPKAALPTPVPVRLREGPDCSGCSGEMYRGYRTLQNGRQVNLWICSDSGCNNEQIA